MQELLQNLLLLQNVIRFLLSQRFLSLGVMPIEHPLSLGMGGMHGSYASNMALTECDFSHQFWFAICGSFDRKSKTLPKRLLWLMLI